MSTQTKTQEMFEELFTIQEIMRVFWVIMDTAIEHYGKPELLSMVDSGCLTRKNGCSVPVFTVAINRSEPEKSSSTPPAHMVARFGEGIAQTLYTAYKRLDMCDWSAMTSLPVVKDKLVKVGAEVEWISIRASKKFIMHSTEEDAKDTDNVQHSVLRIKDAAGNHYIADFTMQQYGWNSDDFFLPEEIYFRRFADSEKWKVTADKWKKDPKDSLERAYVHLVRGFCANLEWEKMAGSDERSRLIRLKEVTAQALKMYLGEA